MSLRMHLTVLLSTAANQEQGDEDAIEIQVERRIHLPAVNVPFILTYIYTVCHSHWMSQ